MATKRIYVIHPNGHQNPAFEGWLAEVVGVLDSDVDWSDWDLYCYECDAQCSVSVRDVYSVVKEQPGPVLIVKPVQRRVIEELKRKLGTRAVVRVLDPSDSTDLYEILRCVKVLHEEGEPLLPQKFVLALLIINKLDTQRMWAGNNAKGFMWASNIHKGRGVDEQFKAIVPGVLGELLGEGLLVAKRSQSRNKFALNPDRREEIYQILRERKFCGERITRILERDTIQVSSRWLDELSNFDTQRD